MPFDTTQRVHLQVESDSNSSIRASWKKIRDLLVAENAAFLAAALHSGLLRLLRRNWHLVLFYDGFLPGDLLALPEGRRCALIVKV